MVSARTLLFLLLCLCAAAPAPAGQERPVNERPMYGNVEKTPAMLQADQAFLESVAKAGMTREQGAVDAVRRGWRALAEGDVRTAIRRFNQGWLLNPDEYGAFWGFGVVLHERDHDCAGAFGMFDRAVALGGEVPSLLTDYGRVCEECGDADKAILLFEKGLSGDPDLQDGYIGLMLSYGRKGDFEQVWRWSERGAARKLLPHYSRDEIKAIILELLNKR